MVTPLLFSPLRVREITLPNRVLISPMSQYSATDGLANDWHLVHAGRFAMGGAGAVMIEATSVLASGRGTPGDLGLWRDDQIGPLARVAGFIAAQGVVPAIQLNHAGAKSARQRPWDGMASLNDEDAAVRREPRWPIVGPSAKAYAPGAVPPRALGVDELPKLAAAWGSAATRAAAAGFKMLELHAAHGYLLHQFLSPLGNVREDEYGGDRSRRMRFPLEVVEQVRGAWPAELPLVVRISATDWVENGWTIEDSVVFARELKERGVDLIACSSGGFGLPPMPSHPGYQAPFAAQIRAEAGIATIAVGLILDGPQAEAHLQNGDADLIAVARQALISPNWALQARWDTAASEGFEHWPPQAGWWLERRKITR